MWRDLRQVDNSYILHLYNWHWRYKVSIWHSALACVFMNVSPAQLLVVSLCPGQVVFCHRDQVAAASPSVSMAARGGTPSAKWISLIGSVIYGCFPLRGIIGVGAAQLMRRMSAFIASWAAELTYVTLQICAFDRPFTDDVKSLLYSMSELESIRA